MTHNNSQLVRPVIVGTDGSDCSAGAIAWAAREAEMRQRPLWIIRVFDPIHTVESALDSVSPVDAQRIAAEIDLSDVVGTVDVNGQPLDGGDAIKLTGETTVRISKGRDSEVLLFDLIQ